MRRVQYQTWPRFMRGVGRVAAIIAAGLVAANAANAADYGKPGEPIHLMAGYPIAGTENIDGLIMAKKGFWKKYLPKGSTVEFQTAVQGSVIVNNMLAGKQQIGFLGDNPAIAATTKQSVGDIRLVAVDSLDPMCNYVLVRADAPKFKTRDEALHWLDGKVVAVTKGSCADRHLQTVINEKHLKPAEVLNQTPELILSDFRAGKIDGAVTWEPSDALLVYSKQARIVDDGYRYNSFNTLFVIMRGDLIEQRPDVVKGLLEGYLDSLLWISDPKNAKEIIDIFNEGAPNISKFVWWESLYGTYPSEKDAPKVRLNFVFSFTPQVMDMIKKDTAFLYSIKSIDVEKLRPEAVMPQFTEEILKERGLKSPVGQVFAAQGKNPYPNPYANAKE